MAKCIQFFLECVSSLVDLVSQPSYSMASQREPSSNTLQYIIAILAPLPPLFRCKEILPEKYVLRRDEKLLRNEHERRLIWNFWIFSFCFRKTGKWDHVRSLVSRPIFGGVAFENVLEMLLYFWSWQHNHIEQQHSAAQQWPIDFLHRRLAEQPPCYFERFRSIFNLLDCMRRRRHRPWTTNDRWHSMPLRLHLILKNHVIWKI